MLRGNPPPPPTSLLFLAISFPSLFKKKSENFETPPPLKYALGYIAMKVTLAPVVKYRCPLLTYSWAHVPFPTHCFMLQGEQYRENFS